MSSCHVSVQTVAYLSFCVFSARSELHSAARKLANTNESEKPNGASCIIYPIVLHIIILSYKGLYCVHTYVEYRNTGKDIASMIILACGH
uniref:Tyrosine-protein kinase n=1 Tax=Parascaris univalens TaxID=6257 RepID=A0A915A0H2_PARUN